MGQAELSYNVATYSMTKWARSVMVYELQPTNQPPKGAQITLNCNQDCKKLAKKWEQILEITKLSLEKARKCHKK